MAGQSYRGPVAPMKLSSCLLDLSVTHFNMCEVVHIIVIDAAVVSDLSGILSSWSCSKRVSSWSAS